MPRPDTFNEGLESFTNYKERLDAFFVANDIAEQKQTATLLSSIGAKTYNTLRCLTSPDLPSSKSYEELCKLLSNHYCPPPLEIVERFKFHKRSQAMDESLPDFLASIKRLAEHCKFGDNLKMSLRDRFVCGIRDETIQKRLLQEPNLTLESATALALAMETAQRDAAEIHTTTSGKSTADLNIIKTNQPLPTNRRHNSQTYPPCQSCGKNNHRRADCYLRNAVCKSCNKQGHIQRVCQARKGSQQQGRGGDRTSQSRQVHELDEDNVSEDNFTLEMFHMEGNTPKINVDLQINNIPTKMEVDTGSAVSVMTKRDFTKTFKTFPNLEKTAVRLKTYTGETIIPLGKISVHVELNNQKKILPLLILDKGSNPILGRDWLAAIKLNWQSIHQMTTPKDRFNTEKLKAQFQDIFSDGIGKIKGIEATLHLKEGAVPKFHKARPVPYALKQKVEKELDNLEEQGIITKIATSDWATPIVPVLKSNGTVRICGDFKVTVNPALNTEQYTMPKMEDMLATLEQGQTFSKIDLRQAYLQLPLDSASQKVTTINTSKGLYSFNRLAFGISSSPAIWQKTIDTILQGTPGVQCNQDDMIVTGKTNDEHWQNLLLVLARLQEYGLKVNLEKCQFFQDEVIFCGVKITKNGLHKTENKVKAIIDAPQPTNKTQLRSFLGLVNYYHKWLENVAQIAKPLYNLLQDNTKFEWSTEADHAFIQIKTMIASDKVLMRYDPDRPLRLACDASPYGIGCVLSHITPEGDERPIAYASRTLNKAEQNYSQLDREALAITWGVKKFFNYVCGRHFTLITDHQPLKYIFSPTKPVPAMSAARQQRYAIFLSAFDYSIEYRNSKSNANADGFSRLPLPTTNSSQEADSADELFYTEVIESLPVNAANVAKESRHDKTLSQVIRYVQTDRWPNTVNEELKPYFNKQNELSVQQNCLFWGYRLIPPQKLHAKILSVLHEGHIGIVKMKNLARGYFWWPAIDKQIEATTKGCPGCASVQPDPPKAPLHPWHWPDKPWQRIQIDFAGPFMGLMFLVVVDAHSKWAEIIPTSNATSISTINILSNLFARFGLPEQLVSDNGVQFTSNEFKSFTKVNGIKHTLSAPYHPATNGLAERMVQTFKQAMKASKDEKGTIHTKLARFLFAYRNAPHTTTNESPASLMFGRHLRTHLDIIRPSIHTRVSSCQDRQLRTHSSANTRNFDNGDNVLVRDYRGHQRWQHGVIHAQTGTRTFEVKTAPGAIWRRHSDQIVHTNTPAITSKPAPAPLLDIVPNFRTTEIPTMVQTTPANDRDPNSTRSQVEVPPSPHREFPNSLSLSDNMSQRTQSQNNHNTTSAPYTTRSGRNVRKPNKFTL